MKHILSVTLENSKGLHVRPIESILKVIDKKNCKIGVRVRGKRYKLSTAMPFFGRLKKGESFDLEIYERGTESCVEDIKKAIGQFIHIDLFASVLDYINFYKDGNGDEFAAYEMEFHALLREYSDDAPQEDARAARDKRAMYPNMLKVVDRIVELGDARICREKWNLTADQISDRLRPFLDKPIVVGGRRLWDAPPTDIFMEVLGELPKSVKTRFVSVRGWDYVRYGTADIALMYRELKKRL